MKNRIKSLALLVGMGLSLVACNGVNNESSLSLPGKQFILSASDVSTLINQCPIFFSISDNIQISFDGNSFNLTNDGETQLTGKWSQLSNNAIKLTIDQYDNTEIVLDLTQTEVSKLALSLADNSINTNAGCSLNKQLIQLKVKGNISFTDGITQLPSYAKAIIGVAATGPGFNGVVVRKTYKNITSIPIPFSIDVPVEQVAGAQYTITVVIDFDGSGSINPGNYISDTNNRPVLNPNIENDLSIPVTKIQ